jgi:hypothetical protein
LKRGRFERIWSFSSDREGHKGEGHKLLSALQVYHLAEQRDAFDVTTEDPTDEMNQVRDEVDVKRLQGRPEVKEAVERALAAAASQRGEAVLTSVLTLVLSERTSLSYVVHIRFLTTASSLLR